MRSKIVISRQNKSLFTSRLTPHAFEEREPKVRWGMVIDLRKCLGCDSCAAVCRAMNKVPPNCWRWIIDCGIGENPDRMRMLLPMSCQHCAEAPCVSVCPTKATYRRPDGIVAIDYERCIGCGYCIVACPYQARTILPKGFEFELGDGPWEPESSEDQPDHAGVCTKCNFCLPRVQAGLAQGLKPGVDAEATPACVVNCSAGALHFGDLDDPESNVSRLLRENRTVRLQEELGTGPAVHYIVPEKWPDLADRAEKE